MSEELRKAALDYHRSPKPGKLEIKSTKPMANQHDLALAYSPGVAAACEEIAEDPNRAADYTARGNLVAVITNGTAVLGLGAIGSLASKPVMEGKAVLFKQFADIDVFDIEVDELDPHQFIETVARLEPSFGGINLEDIKAPECFIIEKALKERMNIPVFHDDQHGTAIVVCAAILNGLKVVGKDIGDIRLVTAGAGAAALACLGLLVELGLKKENIIVTDIAGVVYQGRSEEMDPYKSEYAVDTELRTLEQALDGADLFLGLSAAGVLKADWLPKMAPNPLIMALANPTPEILPEEAKRVRPDAILATGRTDYPNQVNNVLCFPFLFRGALDVGATEINSAMKMACVKAIAEMAQAESSDVVRSAYGGQSLQFGPEYLIPKPFDQRLMVSVPCAVATAAMESGVALRPIEDLDSYRARLQHRVFRTSLTMRPLFERARADIRRIVYAEGEEERVLEVAQQAVDQGIARPVLIGRRKVILQRIEQLGLRLTENSDFEIVDQLDNPNFELHAKTFFDMVQRRGFSPKEARKYLNRNPTVLAAIMLSIGEVDAMICGTVGRYRKHLRNVTEIIGTETGVNKLSSMNALVLHSGTLFMADTYVQEDPSAEDLAEIVSLCAEEVLWFGVQPKVALVSHSNFGSHDSPSAGKMQRVLELVRQRMPDLEIEGEMHADLALSEELRSSRFPNSRLKDSANLLVMPNQDAANIAFNMLKVLGEGIAIGPILIGTAKSAHIVTPSISVRGLLNMTALASVRASCMMKRD
ncbi:MAG: NADP-dependent malic enzyme [Candidatus Thiodiazotropha lotti]|uniref:NADP-dependent malic enzyme n=1 Tax=Candidatus Thiodiazotropha lotti TaxID=2792787 RepID=A0A9E4K4R6_9GAMM|nr:NADP-dependent malic enzyme [Candidatus Thiodiazotropha lotti]MCG7939672.1 NADP-dependent malic enzyme [Candidatus Thiodiazotropha lotti]MCG7989055.1 NADP-dependent malic enzyme [Candidatus Thiodiazotropha lotti]MCG8019543.1 NADP-dependent malic enzyme [Candidatus Thiodiazotropha lotti]MCW4204145.1 NADP-dependent malic enzyme [Candidatus Thiodiazotropha lotti]